MVLFKWLLLSQLVKKISLPRELRKIHNFSKECKILGIETSCDDTGCAIVDNNGNILGEALHSQQNVHLDLGGIIPPFAQSMHRQNIERVVKNAITEAKVDDNEIDAFAVTIKPGLPMSLLIGMKYGKRLSRMYNKPFIPIHHMEAHALMARMVDNSVEYPFLVLLISGGHCLLAVVKNVEEYILLGQSLDDAPGEAFDKTARRLKLRNLSEYKHLSGGQAIELAASRADNPLEFPYKTPLSSYRDCNFSLAGLKNKALRHIIREEKKFEIEPDGVVPSVNNICAGFQLTMTRHLCHRTQRAMEYINLRNLLPEKKTLVVSGGSACNNFIMKGLKLVCDEYGYNIVRPPPKLCTDNGVMIAWNGVEKWQANVEITTDLDTLDVSSRSPLGIDISEDVAKQEIKCKWVKLTSLVNVTQDKLI